MATPSFKIVLVGQSFRGWRLATCEEIQEKDNLETIKELLGPEHHGIRCQLADGQYCSPGYSFRMEKPESSHMILVKLDQDEVHGGVLEEIAVKFQLHSPGKPPPGWDIATYDDAKSLQETVKALLAKTGPKYKIKLADGRINVKKQQFEFQLGDFGTNFRHMLIVRELSKEFCIFKSMAVTDSGWYVASTKDVEENWDEVKKAFHGENNYTCRLSDGKITGPVYNLELTKGKFKSCNLVLKMKDGAVPPILYPGMLEARWWQRVVEFLVKTGVESNHILGTFHETLEMSVSSKIAFQFDRLFQNLPGSSLSYIEGLQHVTDSLNALSLGRRQNKNDRLELQGICQQADRLWRHHLNRITKHGERLRDLKSHLPKDHPDIVEANHILQTCAVVTRLWEGVVNGISVGLGVSKDTLLRQPNKTN